MFILLFVSVNFNDTKLIFYRTILKDRYFREITPIIEDENVYDSDMIISIDIPENYSTVRGVFLIGGWAIEGSRLPDSRIDGIFIYLNNTPINGGKFIGKAAYGGRREDVAEIYGDRFVNSGFNFLVDGTSFRNSLYTFYICFHSRYFGVEYRKLELFVKN